MTDPEPVPRPDLYLQKDVDAWAAQFRLLAYDLGMSHGQIAEIDHGFDPDHPERWVVFSWTHHIAKQFPVIDTAAMIEACRKDPSC